MIKRHGHHLTTLIAAPFIAILVCAGARAGEEDQLPAETSAGWAKSPKNPVLGGELGTCFDICVLKERDTYRMWFSWRPRKSIALVESKNGVEWTKPLIVVGPNDNSGWEDDLNRPIVLASGGRYQMWYTGQARQIVDWICD
jgi:beta-1,2-mannobiose phosphorylase / 1,2-beta-oligomannan phosphorylase